MLIFFNEERFIEEAVQSVLVQTLEDWELILVDDGSTDRSTAIARDFAARDARIRYYDHLGHENRGMSASRNRGVIHSRAPYVAFIDADDVWDPNKLSEQVALLEAMPDVAMICGAMLHWYSWDPNARQRDEAVLTGGTAERRMDPPETAIELYPLGRQSGSGTDVLVRRSVFDSVGGFEERFRGLYEDQAFLMKVYLRFPVYISSRLWLKYRRHADSCVGRATRAQQLRQRELFLNWLEEDRSRLEDARVSTAILRARRDAKVRRAAAPALAAFDHIPLGSRRRVRRAVARISMVLS